MYYLMGLVFTNISSLYSAIRACILKRDRDNNYIIRFQPKERMIQYTWCELYSLTAVYNKAD